MICLHSKNISTDINLKTMCVHCLVDQRHLPYFSAYKTGGFLSLEWLQITKSVQWNFTIIQILPFLNNLKDLDPSYKTDLDFWDCFGRETPRLISGEMRYLLIHQPMQHFHSWVMIWHFSSYQKCIPVIKKVIISFLVRDTSSDNTSSTRTMTFLIVSDLFCKMIVP